LMYDSILQEHATLLHPHSFPTRRSSDLMKQGKLWLLMTALLGLVFLGGQFWEFSHFVHEGLGLTTNLFGSTFYVLTGTHGAHVTDRKSTRLNSSHVSISYAVFCLKKKKS